MAFSEGRNSLVKGGWHWLAALRRSPLWDTLDKQGCFMAHVIASQVRQGDCDLSLPVAEQRRLTGTKDRNKSRCSVGEKGIAELSDAGVLEHLGGDQFRVVMPDASRANPVKLGKMEPSTQNVSDTWNVENHTFHVSSSTQNVQNHTFHVAPYKEEERERENREESARACLRIWPAEKATSPSSFLLAFSRAVESKMLESRMPEPDAIAWVTDRTRAHVAAIKPDEMRFFPRAEKFFEDRIWSTPPGAAGRRLTDTELETWFESLDPLVRREIASEALAHPAVASTTEACGARHRKMIRVAHKLMTQREAKSA